MGTTIVTNKQDILATGREYIASKNDKVCGRELDEYLMLIAWRHMGLNEHDQAVWDASVELRPECGYDCDELCPYLGTPTDR